MAANRIRDRVHDLYWIHDVNCARTMLTCLGELLETELSPQIMHAATGLHGAGGYRAQCGLVEGGLLFLGISLNAMKKDERDIVAACYDYADEFTKEFGSLTCHDLRPAGFSPADPPHMCEKLTCSAVEFAYRFITARHV